MAPATGRLRNGSLRARDTNILERVATQERNVEEIARLEVQLCERLLVVRPALNGSSTAHLLERQHASFVWIDDRKRQPRIPVARQRFHLLEQVMQLAQ